MCEAFQKRERHNQLIFTIYHALNVIERFALLCFLTNIPDNVECVEHVIKSNKMLKKLIGEHAHLPSLKLVKCTL